MVTYTDRLNANLRWAFLEGSLHFERENSVHKAMERITHLLEPFGIPYVILGEMALFFHGVRRFSEEIDILVRREGLEKILHRSEDLGLVSSCFECHHVHDADSGVRINFFLAGDTPGTTPPQPVSFPDPVGAEVVIEGMRFISLPRLIELKLASGMAHPKRLHDLADVQWTIETLRLAEDFASQLHPFVQEKYREVWKIATTPIPGSPDTE